MSRADEDLYAPSVKQVLSLLTPVNHITCIYNYVGAGDIIRCKTYTGPLKEVYEKLPDKVRSWKVQSFNVERSDSSVTISTFVDKRKDEHQLI